MNIEPVIAFHQIPHSDALEQVILQHIAHLDGMSKHLVACRVTIEAPHKSANGQPLHYRTRLELSVPGQKLIAESEPRPDDHMDAYDVVGEAFKKAERQLRDHDEKLREGRQPNEGMESDLEPGFIVALYDEITHRYGFVEDADGRRLYFHENALVDVEFDEIEELMAVKFYEKTDAASPDPVISTLHVELDSDISA